MDKLWYIYTIEYKTKINRSNMDEHHCCNTECSTGVIPSKRNQSRKLWSHFHKVQKRQNEARVRSKSGSYLFWGSRWWEGPSFKFQSRCWWVCSFCENSFCYTVICALSCRDIQKSISKLSLQICILLAFFVFTLYKTIRIGISSHVSTCLIYIVIKNNF